jgi:hypothetical protein
MLTLGQPKVEGQSKLNMLVFSGMVCGLPARVLIKSGAEQNFIIADFVPNTDLQAAAKLVPDRVQMADGSHHLSSGKLPAVRVAICKHRDVLSCHVTRLGGYDLILGKVWLEKLNP